MILLLLAFFILCVSGGLTDKERYDKIKGAIMSTASSSETTTHKETIISLLRKSVYDLGQLEKQFGYIDPQMK